MDMSAYSTQYITREKAEDMVREVRAKKRDDPVHTLSDEELDGELHEYVYSEKHTDIVGTLTNYIISSPEAKD